MTSISTRVPTDHSADDSNLVSFFTTAIIVLAGIVVMAASFSMV